jgi:hypothetical protein
MIDFITAYDGGIKMYANNGFVGYGKTANNIAYILVTKGLAAEVFGGSSMDFANEEGFDTLDGATKLFNEALGIYNWKVNGVA